MRISHSEREIAMNHWHTLLLGLAGALLMGAFLCRWIRRSRQRKEREFTRKLELVLQPRESVKAVCPQKKGSVILTNSRILFDTKDGFHAVPLKSVKKVRGSNEKGNATTVPARMVSLTIQAEKDYTVRNDCGEFPEFAAQLLAKTGKAKKKK